jgi:hypothetical protein
VRGWIGELGLGLTHKTPIGVIRKDVIKGEGEMKRGKNQIENVPI